MSPLVSDELRQLIPRIDSMMDKPSRVRPEVRAQTAELQGILEGAEAMLGPVVDDILTKTGADELRQAIATGVVTVADLGVGMDHALMQVTGSGSDSTVEVQRFVEQVKQRLGDRETRLIFDRGSGELVDELLSQGEIDLDQVALRLAGKAALGTGLVARLPAFTSARMDELLDLRGELAPALIRYRAAVARFSTSVTTLSGEGLDAEVDAVWEEHVAPAIQEVESLLHEHTFVRELARSARQDVGRYLAALGGCWIGVSAATDLGHLATGALAATPEVAHAVGSAWQQSLDGTERARSNEFYYLFAANRELQT